MNCDYKFVPLEQLGDIESKAVLKATARAHQALGELKGLAVTMPNQYLLLATPSLQEAKESSEIENIITTQDDLTVVIINLSNFFLLVQKNCITTRKHYKRVLILLIERACLPIYFKENCRYFSIE